MNGEFQDSDGVDLGKLERMIIGRNNRISFQEKNINSDIYVLILRAMQHSNVYQLINWLSHCNQVYNIVWVDSKLDQHMIYFFKIFQQLKLSIFQSKINQNLIHSIFSSIDREVCYRNPLHHIVLMILQCVHMLQQHIDIFEKNLISDLKIIW